MGPVAKYLIDSDVLIDVLRGNGGAHALLGALGEQWAISQVSALELIVGARNNREAATITEFAGRCRVVPLDSGSGKVAYELLRRYAKSGGLHVFDSLIAATAIVRDCTLVSRNRKHFAQIEGLTLEVPGY